MSDNRRVKDWPARLNRVFFDYQGRDFSYGLSDCGTFANDVIYALIESDIYYDFLAPFYKWGFRLNERTFPRLLRQFGAKSIVDVFRLLANENKFPEIDIKLAQRGDIVAIKIADYALGACFGEYAAFHMKHGLITMKISKCSHAWAIR